MGKPIERERLDETLFFMSRCGCTFYWLPSTATDPSYLDRCEDHAG